MSGIMAVSTFDKVEGENIPPNIKGLPRENSEGPQDCDNELIW